MHAEHGFALRGPHAEAARAEKLRLHGCLSGILLAASDSLERSIFRRSVVLLYEHSAQRGARGVILSQPLGPSDPRLQQQPGAGAGGAGALGPAALLPRGVPALSHFLGGPVGMPGARRSPVS
jgi:hypothetical protein